MITMKKHLISLLLGCSLLLPCLGAGAAAQQITAVLPKSRPRWVILKKETTAPLFRCVL